MATDFRSDPDTYSLRSLLRQPTLESQRHFTPPPMTGSWTELTGTEVTPQDNDGNEARLKRALTRYANSNGHTIRPILLQLLRDYGRFRNRPT